ncbi:MAG: sulfotransferase [Gammaproteobacteria bacterium]|nr:sulfotransferase [Gammaproteobacteria bacterium]MBU2479188.1 sulfotransferase [Gammaproteobacteria bacterium]
MNSAPPPHTPNFFIIGAPKCGTTALSEYLRDHPAIFMCTPKEPYYFCQDFSGLPGPQSLEEYLALFSDAPAHAAALGEASAMYLFSQKAARQIRTFRPDARIIVMLRNPVDLVYSFHSQLLYGLSENEPDFERAWALQNERAAGHNIPTLAREPRFLQYREVARLGKQMQRLLEVFPRDQVHTIFFDDFCTDTRNTYKNVLDFIGVEDDGRTDFARINTNRTFRNELLARLLNRPPLWVSTLVRRLKRVFGLNNIGLLNPFRRANAVVGKRTPISTEFRNQLAEEFQEDIVLLGQLVDRDLSGWMPRASIETRTTEALHT